MLWRISTEDGVAPALRQLFDHFSEKPKHVVYFNSTSPAALSAVARHVPNTEMFKLFDYQRVSSVAEIVAFLQHTDSWVVIEQLDAIVQEPSASSYQELNRDISALMNTRCNVVFLDDWAYLDRYWLRQNVARVPWKDLPTGTGRSGPRKGK